MKKFFKALALLLALVLVIGTIPVSAAQEDFSLKGKTNKKTGLKQKIIYIGGANGVKDDEAGTVCKTGAWANVAKLVKGFDADTMYIELESSDKAIVRTESGKKMADTDKYWIKSKGIGTATVTVKVFRESDDVLLFNDDLMVTVKKNAETVKYQILDSEGNDVTDKKLGANTEYTVILTRLNDEGVQIDTDLRKLEAEEKDKDNVEIKEANEWTTKYTVTFKKSGNFTLKAGAYQSKTYNKVLIPQDIPVTVGYDVRNVAQASVKSVRVTFDQKVAGLTGADFKLYYELTAGTKYYPSAALDKVEMTDNEAIVTFGAPFKQDTEYFLEYNGDKFAFKTAKIDANSVDSVVVVPTKVKAGHEAKIVYKLLNAEGIDITEDSSVKASGWAEFEKIDLPDTSYINVGTESVFIQDAGVSGRVKVTWKWTSEGEVKSKSAEGQVYSVADDKWVFSGEASGVATANNADSYIKDGKINADVAMKHVTVDYASTGAAIQIAVKYDLVEADGTVLKSEYETLETATLKVYDHYELVSSNEKVIMLKGISGKYCNFITNGEGTANVLIKGVRANGTSDILGVVQIKVEPAKKPTSFTATLKDAKVLLNKGMASDSIEIVAVLKNQYDEEITKEPVKIVRLEKGAEKDDLFYTPGVTGSEKVTFTKITGADITAANIATGTLTLRVKCGDFSAPISLSIGDKAEANVITLNLSKAKLDTNVKLDNEADTAVISISGTNAGYVSEVKLASGAAFKFVTKAPVYGADFGTEFGENDIVYTIEKDGKILESINNFDASTNTFTSVVKDTGAASGAAIRLDKGNYTIKAYQIKKVNVDKVGYNVLGSKTLEVTDNQTQVTFEKNNDTFEKLAGPIAEKPIDNAKIASAFKNVKFGDIDVANVVSYDYTTDGNTAYVKSLTYRVINPVLGYRDVTVPVDILVRVG